MKRIVLTAISIIFTGLLLFFGCAKKRAFRAEDAQSAVDEKTVMTENDLAINDVQLAVMDQALLRGRMAGTEDSTAVGLSLCGCKMDTSTVYDGAIMLNYNGEICYDRQRQGSIRIEVVNYPVEKWRQQGSRLKIDYTGYKVTRMSDGKSVEFNGTQYLINESGMGWYELVYQFEPKLVHKLTSEIFRAKFDGTKSTAHHIDRTYTYTYKKNRVYASIIGNATHDGKTSVHDWGETRDGIAFTGKINSPVTWNTSCTPLYPTGGKLDIDVTGKGYVIDYIFGTDSGGEPAMDSECSFGWKAEWNLKRKTRSIIFEYN